VKKKCPYCGEIIQIDALICRYCKSRLFTDNSDQQNKPIFSKPEHKCKPKQKYIFLLFIIIPIIIMIFPKGKKTEPISLINGEISNLGLIGKFVFSFDGNIFLWENGMEKEKQITELITEDETGGWLGVAYIDPHISPDGKKVVFKYYQHNSESLFLMNSGGDSISEISPLGPMYDSIQWSKDSKKILFYMFWDTESDSAISIYNVENGSISELIPRNGEYGRLGNPTWSSDNQSILFECNWEICIMDLSTKSVNLVTNEFSANNPDWSPLGDKISFNSDELGSNTNQVYIMNSDGSDIIQLTDNSFPSSYPNWSPDGNQLLITSNTKPYTSLALLNPYIPRSDFVIYEYSVNSSYKEHPLWSPDGKWILIDADHVYLFNQAKNEIYVFCNECGFPSWSER